MGYPVDVIGKSSKKKETEQAEKAKLVLIILLISAIAIYILFNGLMTTLGIPKIVLAIVLITMYLTIFVFIFRFMIYREQDKLTQDTDSVLQYYNIANKVEKESDINIYFHEDNIPFIMLRLRKGMSNKSRVLESKIFLAKIFDLVEEFNLEQRVIVLKEKFTDTAEYQYMMNTVNRIKEPLLRNSTLQMYEVILNKTELESNLSEFYIKVSAPTKLHQSELVDFAIGVNLICKKHLRNSTFRSMNLITKKEIEEVMRRFLQVKMLDLTAAEVEYSVSNKDFLNMVTVKAVLTDDNKWYSSVNKENLMKQTKAKRISGGKL